jgi:hypothetical protein
MKRRAPVFGALILCGSKCAFVTCSIAHSAGYTMEHGRKKKSPMSSRTKRQQKKDCKKKRDQSMKHSNSDVPLHGTC